MPNIIITIDDIKLSIPVNEVFSFKQFCFLNNISGIPYTKFIDSVNMTLPDDHKLMDLSNKGYSAIVILKDDGMVKLSVDKGIVAMLIGKAGVVVKEVISKYNLKTIAYDDVTLVKGISVIK